MTNYPDWLKLIQDVNLGPTLMPWMLENAVSNYYAYLMAVIASPHREPWMLYKAVYLVFSTAPDEVKVEVNKVLTDNHFEEVSFKS